MVTVYSLAQFGKAKVSAIINKSNFFIISYAELWWVLFITL